MVSVKKIIVASALLSVANANNKSQHVGEETQAQQQGQLKQFENEKLLIRKGTLSATKVELTPEEKVTRAKQTLDQLPEKNTIAANGLKEKEDSLKERLKAYREQNKKELEKIKEQDKELRNERSERLKKLKPEMKKGMSDEEKKPLWDAYNENSKVLYQAYRKKSEALYQTYNAGLKGIEEQWREGLTKEEKAEEDRQEKEAAAKLELRWACHEGMEEVAKPFREKWEKFDKKASKLFEHAINRIETNKNKHARKGNKKDKEDKEYAVFEDIYGKFINNQIVQVEKLLKGDKMQEMKKKCYTCTTVEGKKKCTPNYE